MEISERKISSEIQFLHDHLNSHPIWNCRLLNAFDSKHLKFEDIQFVFSQYHLYSKNFTRYLSGLMANLEDDFLRAKLSENIWEEGGEKDPEKRHSYMFKSFLTSSLKIDLNYIRYEGFTKQFVQRYLDQTISGNPLETSAFLSVGTEAMVPRLYKSLLKNLSKIGLSEKNLEFFHLHLECDDEHAEILEEILLSFKNEPRWRERALNALDLALNLRMYFFENLFDSLRHGRVTKKLDKIQDRKSLMNNALTKSDLVFNLSNNSIADAEQVYSNKLDRQNIDFSVCRAPFPAEVIDARVVSIAPGKCNERHKHAHESIFYVLKGSVKVMVDDTFFQLQEGESIFVPRWAIHQTQNTGAEECIIYAITDFYLTGSALIGNYNSTARMNHN